MLHRMGSVAFIVAAVAAFTACDGSDTVTGDEADLSATSGSFKVSINALSGQNGVARVHGLANQGLEHTLAFIPDDEIGSTHDSPKSFITSFHGSELRQFFNGRPAFFGMSTSAGEHYTARADLAVKLHVASPASIKVTTTSSSVLVGGVSLIRVKGIYSKTLTGAKATVDGADLAGTVSGKSWSFDYPIPFMSDVVANETPLAITLTTASGHVSGKLDATLKVDAIELTTDDAYDVWPTPSCDPDILSCIQMPANAVDTSACGDAWNVAPCWNQIPH